MTSVLSEILLAAGLFTLLLLAMESGFRLGRRSSREEGDARAAGQVGAIQGAVLGLLGLLLAFSFAAAGARFLERQDLIVAEANAIGTASLRADLLDEPHRSELRDSLRLYTEYRIQISLQLRKGATLAILEAVEHQHGQIWAAARDGVAAKPAAMLGVLPPVNEVIDLHSLRLASGKKHIPPLVMGVLIASSVLAIAVIGYGCGVGGRRRVPLTVSLALLIGTSLWITIDLDHPRAGLMQLSEAPIKALKFDPTPE